MARPLAATALVKRLAQRWGLANTGPPKPAAERGVTNKYPTHVLAASEPLHRHADKFPTHAFFRATGTAHEFKGYHFNDQTDVDAADMLRALDEAGISPQARARAFRFVVSRMRSRIIRRFVLGGTMVAPVVGAVFAAKAGVGELRRAAREMTLALDAPRPLGARRFRVPALFAFAGILDSSNSVVGAATVCHALTALASSGQHAETGLTAGAIAGTVTNVVPAISWASLHLGPFLSPTLSLGLALGATVCAVGGEVVAAMPQKQPARAVAVGTTFMQQVAPTNAPSPSAQVRLAA